MLLQADQPIRLQYSHQIKLLLNNQPAGKQTHDLTVIASDSKTTQSGGDNRK
jgi:hypothetical protein